jgi:hypothetical protein
MSETTTQARTASDLDVSSPPAGVDRARAAWATASRDTELARWHELYDRAVPAPATSMTARERWLAGWPARDADERARYRELDQASAR